jgi:hypothetical protein
MTPEPIPTAEVEVEVARTFTVHFTDGSVRIFVSSVDHTYSWAPAQNGALLIGREDKHKFFKTVSLSDQVLYVYNSNKWDMVEIEEGDND